MSHLKTPQKTTPSLTQSPSSKPGDPPESTSQYNYPHKFITAYGPKSATPMTFEGPGKTKQSFKDETDINNILARFQRTGLLEFTNKNQPQYADCTGIEYQAGMETIRKASALFQSLPSSVRARFHNEPAEFLDFVQDDKNRDEARQMGLLRPEEPKATPAPTSHSHQPYEPLRASDGTFREHTRAELREDRREEQSRRETGASERDTPPPPKGGVDQFTT